MLLLGAILLAIFVLPSPWGIVAIVAGGLTDIAESVVFLKWSRRRRSVTGVEALVGGDEVEVTGVDGLTLQVSRLRRAPR